ncbi:MAG: hypothetical protein JXB88_05645 [Spirochaetales bacterium]|nr:hypothetical protein [Spirochaetales bacterium]
MKVKKIFLSIACVCSLLLFVTTCDLDVDTDTGNTAVVQDRASRPCETACAQANGTCHGNCGANASCHEACDQTYQNCLGYWTTTKSGTSICDITSKTNYITLHFTVYLKTKDIRGFKGCDGAIWPDYGTQISTRTLESRSFWLWQGGDAEAWINQKIAQYGMGIGCP